MTYVMLTTFITTLYIGTFYAKRPKLTHYIKGRCNNSQQVWRKKAKIEKFHVHKLSRISQYRIFRVLNFRQFGQKFAKFGKVSAPKVMQSNIFHVLLAPENMTNLFQPIVSE